jgi:hypothetical protein
MSENIIEDGNIDKNKWDVASYCNNKGEITIACRKIGEDGRVSIKTISNIPGFGIDKKIEIAKKQCDSLNARGE